MKDANVWGTVPGTSDEEIVVIAHHDGYFEAAFDNASGMATQLGMAEHFAKVPPAQRKRAITFVSTAAHHASSPGTRWMYDHRDTAMAKTVLVINCGALKKEKDSGSQGLFLIRSSGTRASARRPRGRRRSSDPAGRAGAGR